MKRFVLSLALLLLCAAVAHAQQQTGEIFGKVTDRIGRGAARRDRHASRRPMLLQPLIAVTSETGTYQFPRLAIGTYTVKFELGRLQERRERRASW